MVKSVHIHTFTAHFEIPSLFGDAEPATKTEVEKRVLFEFFENGTFVFTRVLIVDLSEDENKDDEFFKERLHQAYKIQIKQDPFFLFTQWSKSKGFQYEIEINDTASIIPWLIDNPEEIKKLLGIRTNRILYTS